MKIIITILLLLVTFEIYSCPLTIINYSNQIIIVVDPRGSEAIFLKENSSAIIDPTIANPLLQYVINEKLDIYYPQETHPNVFYKKYRVMEKYCSDNPEENKLTLSQILQFVDHPSKRFKVEEFESTEKSMEHKH